MNVEVSNVTVTLRPEVCCNCGCHFAMDERLYDDRRRDGRYFYCPNGHSQHYAETVEQRLRKELQHKENELYWEKMSHSSTKGQFTKYRNRVAKGVCPCCNRSFANVARHMASQHPDEPVSQAALAAAEAKRNEPPQKNIVHTWGNQNRLKLQKCQLCGVMRGNIEKHWAEVHQGTGRNGKAVDVRR